MWYIHAIEYSAIKENETTQMNLEGIMPSKILISHTEKGNYCRMPYMYRSKKTGQTKVSHSIMSKSLGPHGLYRPWNCPGQNTGVGCHALLQGIFPTQGLNPGLPHCRQILYHLSHQGSPRMLEWVANPFSSRSLQPGNRTGVSCIAGRFFTS